MKNEKTPKILIAALRQYQHNDCSGLLAGFDYSETIKIVSSLHSMQDKADELINALYQSGCLDLERENMIQAYLSA